MPLGKPGKSLGPRAFGTMASHLNIKTLLWFFMFLGCSPRIKIADRLMTAFGILIKETDNFGVYRF